eukprot:9675041-Lingulodinium_polyedra.AAC.1
MLRWSAKCPPRVAPGPPICHAEWHRRRNGWPARGRCLGYVPILLQHPPTRFGQRSPPTLRNDARPVREARKRWL